jgi:hypothetical protein
MGNKIDAWEVLVEKAEQKRPLGRRRHRRENDIKVYLQEGRWGA